MNLPSTRPLPASFFDSDVDIVAKSLIGTFVFKVDELGNRTGGKIVETEAYDQNDPAAHCHKDASKTRFSGSGSMRLKGGHAYVYPYRGMWCLNFTCGSEGFGSAVLLRALEPLSGLEIMRQRRIEGAQAVGLQAKDLKGASYLKHLCSGPAKLCEALGIDKSLDGHSLYAPPFELYARADEPTIRRGPRVGVTKAQDVLRRYAMDTNFLSNAGAKYPLSDSVE